MFRKDDHGHMTTMADHGPHDHNRRPWAILCLVMSNPVVMGRGGVCGGVGGDGHVVTDGWGCEGEL